jgi:hypothetical protein
VVGCFRAAGAHGGGVPGGGGNGGGRATVKGRREGVLGEGLRMGERLVFVFVVGGGGETVGGGRVRGGEVVGFGEEGEVPVVLFFFGRYWHRVGIWFSLGHLLVAMFRWWTGDLAVVSTNVGAWVSGWVDGWVSTALPVARPPTAALQFWASKEEMKRSKVSQQSAHSLQFSIKRDNQEIPRNSCLFSLRLTSNTAFRVPRTDEVLLRYHN